jgi:endo-1,4-beta-xylanase
MYLRKLVALIMSVTLLASIVLPCNIIASYAETPRSYLTRTYDFEDGTNNGWTANGGEKVTVSSETAHGGEKSLKVSERTASDDNPFIKLGDSVVNGSTYSVTMWVFQDGGCDEQVTVTASTCSGDTESVQVIAIENNVPSGKWTEISGNVKVNYTGDLKDFNINVKAATVQLSYYIDDVSIIGPALVNSDFEDGDIGGCVKNDAPDSYDLTNTEDIAHSGTKSLMVSNRTQSYQGPVIDLTNTASNTQKLLVSFWLPENRR